jgi:hypothetical protein
MTTIYLYYLFLFLMPDIRKGGGVIGGSFNPHRRTDKPSHTSSAKSLSHSQSAETTANHHFTANAISEIFKRQKLVSEFPTPFAMVSL